MIDFCLYLVHRSQLALRPQTTTMKLGQAIPYTSIIYVNIPSKQTQCLQAETIKTRLQGTPQD